MAKLAAAYRAAFQPRLLVLVGLALVMFAYNRLAEEPLPLVYQGCVLGGFLSYKAALIVKLIDELTPKVSRSWDGNIVIWRGSGQQLCQHDLSVSIIKFVTCRSKRGQRPRRFL